MQTDSLWFERDTVAAGYAALLALKNSTVVVVAQGEKKLGRFGGEKKKEETRFIFILFAGERSMVFLSWRIAVAWRLLGMREIASEVPLHRDDKSNMACARNGRERHLLWDL